MKLTLLVINILFICVSLKIAGKTGGKAHLQQIPAKGHALFFNDRNKPYQPPKNANMVLDLDKNKASGPDIQQQQVKLRDTQLWSLAIIAIIFIAATAIASFYYLRMRHYMISLYKANVEKAATTPFTEVKEVKEIENDRSGEIYNQIVTLMDQEYLYLKADLNIADLSKRLNTNSKYVSHSINQFSNGNFNTFLNRYRINYAKKLIIQNARMSLKSVSAESGFNNHTTFYRQFKEVTGLTPTQFIGMSRQTFATGETNELNPSN